MNAVLERLTPAWGALEEMIPLRPIESVAHYEEMLALMDALLDEVGEDASHPLASLLHVVGNLIRDYDEEHHAIPEASGIELLRFLMEQHGLRQCDLPELGSQGVVSEILRGRRALNLRQVQELANRFKVPMECFVAR